MSSTAADSAVAKGMDGDAAPAPEVVSRAKAEQSSQTLLILLMSAALLPRLILLPLNENLFGDAVIRTELAARWAAHPHWISSYADGAFQFGPLHLYLMGILLQIWPSQEHVGRLLSLIFGVLSVIPLFALTRRLMGKRAAVWACPCSSRRPRAARLWRCFSCSPAWLTLPPRWRRAALRRSSTPR